MLERFVGLCGGTRARITLVTTAAGVPDAVHAEYEPVLLTYEKLAPVQGLLADLGATLSRAGGPGPASP